MYRGPGLLAVVWFGSSPSPPPSPVSKLDRRHTGRLRKKDNLLTEEGGGGAGEGPNHTTAWKPGPLEIIQYSLSRCITFYFYTVLNSIMYLREYTYYHPWIKLLQNSENTPLSASAPYNCDVSEEKKVTKHRNSSAVYKIEKKGWRNWLIRTGVQRWRPVWSTEIRKAVHTAQ